MLALSSLTRRSLYVGIAWAGLWIISGSVAFIMTGIQEQAIRRGTLEDEMSQWVANHPPPAGVQMRGWNPAVQWNPKQKEHLIGLEAGQEEAGQRWYQAWSRARQMAWVKSELNQAEAARENWWPICSYVANLNRIADLLLDTESAWVKTGKAMLASVPAPGPRGGFAGDMPPELRKASERRLADRNVAQFPWWWSGAVLTGLLGVSTWTLTRRVKSLDRLR
jgi:hypothetical protein